MSKTTVSMNITPEEYELFARLMPDEQNLQCTYEVWVRKRSQEDATRIAQGYALKHVTVHHQEFTIYCHSIGQPPSYSLLEAFAVKQSHQQA